MILSGAFLGIGFKNVVGIAVFTIILIVVLKVVLAKYPIKGASDIVHAV